MKYSTPAFPSHGSMGEVSQEGMSLETYAVIHGPWTAMSIMELHSGKEMSYEDIQQAILDANMTYAEMMRDELGE